MANQVDLAHLQAIADAMDGGTNQAVRYVAVKLNAVLVGRGLVRGTVRAPRDLDVPKIGKLGNPQMSSFLFSIVSGRLYRPSGQSGR